MTWTLGVIGGTGTFGSALAGRLAANGVPVIIGSRDADRGAQKAAEVRKKWGLESSMAVGGDTSLAAQADVVLVSLPYDALDANIGPVAGALGGKVVVSSVNRLERHDGEFVPPRWQHDRRQNAGGHDTGEFGPGSAAEHLQRLLPDSKIATAFNHIAARRLGNPEFDLDADVLVAARDYDTFLVVADIVKAIPILRPVAAGSLALAQAVEDFTAVMVSVNRRYRSTVSIQLNDLEGIS